MKLFKNMKISFDTLSPIDPKLKFERATLLNTGIVKFNGEPHRDAMSFWCHIFLFYDFFSNCLNVIILRFNKTCFNSNLNLHL